MWIYVAGEREGRDVKIGHTKDDTIRRRLQTVNSSQTTNESYVLLASMLGPAIAEKNTHRYFEGLRRTDKGRRTEYFEPADELVEWVVWLRQQWWTCFDVDKPQADWSEEHHSAWVPAPERRQPRPQVDASKLVQDYVQLTGPLADTAWAWMPDPLASFQDYFTPPELVARASVAMGSIDLDAASHWIANRRLHEAGVEIGDYFTINRSAFENDWVGNVWLNPPYGENERWFERARQMMDDGKLAQMCMLSPIYAFTTGVAAEMLARARAAVILTPTPKFFNPGDPSKDGTNLPHAVFYWGPRAKEFLAAYEGAGIPAVMAW